METPIAVKDNLEVTGVSRSGRVRKKSSKLVDFQSPDDIDASRAKRPVTQKISTSKNTLGQQQQQQQQQQVHSDQQSSAPISPNSLIQSPTRIKMEPSLHITNNTLNHINYTTINVPVDDATGATGSDDEGGGGGGGGGDNDMEVQSDDDDPNALLIDTTVRRSAYMTEKSAKKKVYKDGKLVTKKPQRKDKGKSRFTAYMLWAKDVRQDMLSTYPDLDFSTISRRLGEMWANVPSNEKYNWRRRAKRLAAKNKDNPNNLTTMKPTTVPAIKSQFLNRNMGGKAAGTIAKKISAERVKTTSESRAAAATIIATPTKASNSASKLSGTAAIDVAAHLKLLGDSLTIIGSRLKEHEGQIAVSGSLSVLLDSLLCSVAPLMCLSAYIPEIGVETVAEIKEIMSHTLDNIAYVMPGL